MSEYTDPRYDNMIRQGKSSRQQDILIKCNACGKEITKSDGSGGYVIRDLFIGPCCEGHLRECPQIVSFIAWAINFVEGE